MAEKPNDPNEIGALWIKTGARGDYMTGTINGQPVVLFKNDRKLAGSNQPDWRVKKPTPKDAVSRGSAESAPPRIPFDDDTIPF